LCLFFCVNVCLEWSALYTNPRSTVTLTTAVSLLHTGESYYLNSTESLNCIHFISVRLVKFSRAFLFKTQMMYCVSLLHSEKLTLFCVSLKCVELMLEF
jgi:hypothetical protein